MLKSGGEVCLLLHAFVVVKKRFHLSKTPFSLLNSIFNPLSHLESLNVGCHDSVGRKVKVEERERSRKCREN